MFSLKARASVLVAIAIGLLAVLAAACGESQQRAGAEMKPQPPQTTPAAPADAPKLEQLGRLADDMYKLTMSGSYLEARARLLDMSALATHISYAGVTTVEGMQAFAETMTEAKRAFNAVKLDMEQTKLSAAKVKLAVDAITHKNDPMWLQYERLLQEDAQALDKGIRTKDAKAVQYAVAGLKAHYAIIRPAVLISREPQLNEKMESLLAFLAGQSRATPLPAGNLEQGASHLRDMLNELFGREDKSAYAPIVDNRRPIIWTIVIGSVITAILAYAAWQMFRDGRGAVPIRKKEQG
ncbi:hypothetical protein SD70_06870 [Gordoniibacillus kamchatkensis]|uniref:Sporulation protein YpjB n=1 Tax=Gordoniibacillus kamchatkensis TaxID=1590651 RepID=A0ABR5AKY3_9BACL|nr:sporulation protein YpjB [Paenibacillus sp. VKM B-2647]KIL41572.1 hypothetical protein SD70_06870 [Paenibacillus sp. VKM B-2647]